MFTIKGEAATLRWAWHEAATLRSWEVSNWTATAKVVSIDDFRVTQSPLKFVAYTPQGHQWTWAVKSVAVTGDTVNIALVEE